MSGVRMRDGRRLPFFQVTKAETARLAEVAESRSLPHLRSLYFAVIEIANDHRADEVAVSRAELAHSAGISPETVKRLTPTLIDAGLVRVDERPGYPSVWTVLGVGSDGPGGSGLADPGVGSASGGGSGLADPGLKETGQEVKKETPTESHIDVLWAHYSVARKAAKPRSMGFALGPADRRLIINALKVRDVETCKAAIEGLFRSDFHMQRGYIGLAYALRGGGRSPDPGTTIDRLAHGNGNGNGRGGLLASKTYRGRSWDELTAREQENAKDAASMGLEVWDGGKDAWQDRPAQLAAGAALVAANGNGHVGGYTAENILDD